MKIFLLTASLLHVIAITGNAIRVDDEEGAFVADLFMLAYPNDPEKNYEYLQKNENFETSAFVCEHIAVDDYNESPNCKAYPLSTKVTLDGTYSDYDVSVRNYMQLVYCSCPFSKCKIEFYITKGKANRNLYYVLKQIPHSEYLIVKSLYDISNRILYNSKVPESWGTQYH